MAGFSLARLETATGKNQSVFKMSQWKHCVDREPGVNPFLISLSHSHSHSHSRVITIFVFHI